MKRLNFSRKKVRTLGFSILGILVLAIVLGFAFRNAILEQIIAKAAVKMQTDYQCELVVKNPHFEGLNHIEIEGISLTPHHADTLVYVGHVRTGFNLWKLLTGTLQITDLEINRGYIQLVKTKNGSNFDAFLRKKEKQNTTTTLDYAELANRLSSRFLNLIPTQMEITGFALKINDKGHKVHLDFTQLALHNEQLKTAIQLTEGAIHQQWQLSGFADPRNRKADLVFKNQKNDTLV
ncbi:MAG: glycosyl transferase, partial [Flavobacterium stagni]